MALELIATTELVEELARRHAGLVVVYVDHDDNTGTFLDGSGLVCLGLLEQAKGEILLASLRGFQA